MCPPRDTGLCNDATWFSLGPLVFFAAAPSTSFPPTRLHNLPTTKNYLGQLGTSWTLGPVLTRAEGARLFWRSIFTISNCQQPRQGGRMYVRQLVPIGKCRTIKHEIVKVWILKMSSCFETCQLSEKLGAIKRPRMETSGIQRMCTDLRERVDRFQGTERLNRFPMGFKSSQSKTLRSRFYPDGRPVPGVFLELEFRAQLLRAALITGSQKGKIVRIWSKMFETWEGSYGILLISSHFSSILFLSFLAVVFLIPRNSM